MALSEKRVPMGTPKSMGSSWFIIIFPIQIAIPRGIPPLPLPDSRAPRAPRHSPHRRPVEVWRGGIQKWDVMGYYNLKDSSTWMFCLFFFGWFLDDSEDLDPEKARVFIETWKMWNPTHNSQQGFCWMVDIDPSWSIMIDRLLGTFLGVSEVWGWNMGAKTTEKLWKKWWYQLLVSYIKLYPII